MRSAILLVPAIFGLALAGCAKDAALDEGGGLRVTRSTCPAVAIPAYTGDISLFSPAQSRDARALDVAATITNLRTTCDESGARVAAGVTFDVVARRANPAGARELTLPYFATVVRAGNRIVSKQLGEVVVRFADGQARALATASAGADIDRAAASLPAAVASRINRPRKATDQDASIDPMNEPATRAAIVQANFELLIGFQLSQPQIAYNATK